MSDDATFQQLDNLLADIKEKYVSHRDFWDLYTKSGKTLRILTVNLEILKALLHDRDILDKSDACTVDSALLQWAMGRMYGSCFERLTGREIVERSVDYLSKRGVLLFGASDEARHKALQRYLALAGPNARVQGFDESVAIGSDVSHEARLCGFFAYGYPKQERKIDAFRILNPDRPVVLIGVGGAIDYFSGSVKRPPKIATQTGFEWLWRLLTQPKARVRRIAAIVPFALRLAAHSYLAQSLK